MEFSGARGAGSVTPHFLVHSEDRGTKRGCVACWGHTACSQQTTGNLDLQTSHWVFVPSELVGSSNLQSNGVFTVIYLPSISVVFFLFYSMPNLKILFLLDHRCAVGHGHPPTMDGSAPFPPPTQLLSLWVEGHYLHTLSGVLKFSPPHDCAPSKETPNLVPPVHIGWMNFWMYRHWKESHWERTPQMLKEMKSPSHTDDHWRTEAQPNQSP